MKKLIKFYDWDGSAHLLKEDNKKVIESIPIVDRKGHIINDMKKNIKDSIGEFPIVEEFHYGVSPSEFFGVLI